MKYNQVFMTLETTSVIEKGFNKIKNRKHTLGATSAAEPKI